MRRSYLATPPPRIETREDCATRSTYIRSNHREIRDENEIVVARETVTKRNAKTSLLSELNQEREKCRIAEETVRRLEQVVKLADNERSQTVKEIAKRTASTTSIVDEQAQKLQILEKEKKNLALEVKKLNSRKVYVEKEFTGLKNMINQSKEEVNDLKNQNSTLKAREAELSQRIQTIERFDNTKEQNMSAVNKKLVEYKEKLYGMESREQEFEEKLQSMESKEQEQRKKLTAFEKSKDGIQFVHSSMANDIKKFQHKIQLQEENEQELIIKTELLEKTMTDAGNAKKKIERELENLKEEFKVKEMKWNSMSQEQNNQKNSLKKDLNKAKRELESCKTQIEKKSNDATDEVSMIKRHYESELKDAYEESKHTKSCFENLLKNLHVSVAEKSYEKDELEMSLADLREEYEQERTSSQSYFAEVETLRSLLDANEFRVKALSSETNVLKSTIKINETDLLSLKESNETHEQEMCKLQYELVDNQDKLDELKDMKMGLQSNLSNLRHDLEMKSTVNVNLEKIIDTNNGRMTEQAKESHFKLEELSQANEEIKQKDNTIHELVEKITLTESFLGEEQSNSQKLFLDNAVLRKEINTTKRVITALESKKENLIQSLEKVRGNLIDSESELETCNIKIPDLEKNIISLERSVESEKKINSVLRAQIQTFQSVIENNDTQIKELHDDVDESEVEQKDLKEKLQVCNVEQKDLKEKLQVCNVELDEKMNEMDILQKKLKDLERNHDDALEEIEDNDREIEEHEASISNLKGKIESTIMKFQKSEKDKDELRNKIEEKDLNVVEVAAELEFTLGLLHKEKDSNKEALSNLEKYMEKKARKALLNAKGKRTQLIDIIRILKEQIHEISNKKSDLKIEVSDLQSKGLNALEAKFLVENQLSDSKATSLKAFKEIENIKSSNASLRAVIKAKETKLVNVNDTTNQLKLLIDEKSKTLDDVENSLFAANKKLQSFEVMFSSLSMELKTAKEAIDGKAKAETVLRGILSSVKKENRILRAKLEGINQLMNTKSTSKAVDDNKVAGTTSTRNNDDDDDSEIIEQYEKKIVISQEHAIINNNTDDNNRTLLPCKTDDLLNLFAELEASRRPYADDIQKDNDIFSKLKVKLVELNEVNAHG